MSELAQTCWKNVTPLKKGIAQLKDKYAGVKALNLINIYLIINMAKKYFQVPKTLLKK